MALKKFRDAQLGEKIKEVREALGLTQEVFAAKLNYSQGAIDQWEHGRVPPAVVIREIAKLSHVSTDQLLGLPADPGIEPLLSDLKQLVRKYEESHPVQTAQLSGQKQATTQER
jgi:transcriptional regulator with XRE-family HTH domain